MSTNVIAWLLAIATGAWFGFLALRMRRNWISAAVTGGLFGLITSTVVFGLAQASTFPFSDRERSQMLVLWTLVSILLIGIVSAGMTLLLLRTGQPRTAAAVSSATPVEAKPAKKTT